MHPRSRRLHLWFLTLAALVALPAVVAGQTLPSVRRFVDFLDVACYQISGQPAINLPLRLDHLNPVLSGQPFENVVLGAPQQLCVPVQKNSLTPPSDTLPFIQYVDWKCYAITGPALNLPLTLTQLNPAISSLLGPTDRVTVRAPQQLCVPVYKNSSPPPPAVQHLVQYLDLKCYGVDASQPVAGTLQLTHLNPLFSTISPSSATLVGPRAVQLCVPVEKNQQAPPSDVLPYAQFSDVLCYNIQAAALNRQLTLTHLNPVLLGLGAKPENVPVTSALKLCVPVAKNGMLPPGPP